MKEIIGIHHCEILVTDVDQAMDFYKNKIGLTEIPNPSTIFRSSKWLLLGNQQLHITHHETPDGSKFRHFALHVSDLEAVKEKLTTQNVEIVPARPIPGINRFFIFDPFGNRIEFVEPIK